MIIIEILVILLIISGVLVLFGVDHKFMFIIWCTIITSIGSLMICGLFIGAGIWCFNYIMGG